MDPSSTISTLFHGLVPLHYVQDRRKTAPAAGDVRRRRLELHAGCGIPVEVAGMRKFQPRGMPFDRGST